MTNEPTASIPFAFPGVKGVRCLFSTSRSGDMSLKGDPEKLTEAAGNRESFMREAGFSEWSENNQVHGDRLAEAEGRRTTESEELADADGLYTRTRGIGLVIKTADCQPVMLAREDGRAIAGLHVGWRGNAMNFPGTAVARLCRLFSCRPEDLLAVRGPSLGPAASEFVNFAREWPEEFAPWLRPGDKTVNLWALTRHQLEEAGLRPERIFSLDMCTRDMADCFFSYRRGDQGRMANAIWME